MRILLDECVPRRLRSELAGHDVFTAVEMGWSGKQNGELLALAEAHFDVFLTLDRNISYQQNVSTLQLRMIVLRSKKGDLASLKQGMPEVRALLNKLKPGEIAFVETQS